MNTVAARRLPGAREGLPQASADPEGRCETPITSQSAVGYGHDRSSSTRRHPDLLDWAETAALLGCSRTTLKRIKAAGEIGFTPVGSGSRPRIWFTRKDVEEYLAAKHRGPLSRPEPDRGTA